MPKNKLQKHTMNFRPGDIAAISEAYSSMNIPASVVVRTIVSNFVDRLNGPPPEINVNDIEGVDL